MIKKEGLLKIGRFLKPHGIDGEIALLTNYEISSAHDDFYFICEMDGIFVPFFVESYRTKNDTTKLVKFEDIDTEDLKKQLAGKEVYLPSEILAPSDKEKYKQKSLIGYQLKDETYGVIGYITDIDERTINVLLKVRYNDKDILVPKAFITLVHPDERIAEVLLPSGFLETENFDYDNNKAK